MAKKRHIKNVKHSLRKHRNRIRRKGDFWYSKLWILNQRKDAKKIIDDEVKNA
jgi:hypothetical protein